MRQKEFNAALEELRKFTVPVVEWKVYAEIARLKTKSADTVGARDALTESLSIVNSIAANVKDEKLRETFLNSAALQELQNGVAPV